MAESTEQVGREIRWVCLKCRLIITVQQVTTGRATIPHRKQAGPCPNTLDGNHLWRPMDPE